MITYAASKISSFFIHKKIILEKDKEVYDYCFEVLIAFLLNFIIIISLALITRTFLFGMLFLLAFLPLRITVGGYHANTHLKCMITLVFTYLIFVSLIRVFPANLITVTCFGILALSESIIFLFAPSEDKNNPLNKNKKCQLRLRGRIIGMLYALISVCGLFVLKNLFLTFSFVLGFFTVALSVLANKIKYQLTED